MLENYFGPDVTQRLRAGRLGDHLDAFVATLAEAGYSRLTVQIRLQFLSHLGEWLRRTRRTVADLVHTNTAEAFLTAYQRRLRLKNGDRRTLQDFVEHLQHQGVIGLGVEASPDKRPTLELEQRYDAYLRQERGLTDVTIQRYRWFVQRFFRERFGEEPVAVGQLNARDVSSFVIKDASSVGHKRAQLMVTALRSFFRFLVQEGETAVDLSVSVLSVPCRAQATVPRYISDREVEQLLRSCDRSTPVGRRDYAILLLLARLGLRAGEVASLQLEDIDWRSGEIRVLGKGQVRHRLPLLPEVGEALVAYLRRDRPQSSSRCVFLRMKAPRRGFTRAAVTNLVGRALARAGLKPPFKGAHLLRHSLATNLLRKGASLAELAELLRHRSFATTRIYAKVDSGSLRELAQPWPTMGGER